MLKYKKILTSILLIFALVSSNLYMRVYAAQVAVTKENLSESLKKIESSEGNEEGYTITVSDDVITVKSEKGTYDLSYDLTGKPTFSIEVSVSNGMTYDKFKEETDKLNLPLLGYLATANIQGVEYEDAILYFTMYCAGESSNNSGYSSNQYVIIDDTKSSEGVTINRDENDTNTIYVSEFGEHVMEYTNSLYKDNSSIADAQGINSFVWEYSKKDVTDSSCKIVSTLSVNIDADFSKLDGYTDKMLSDESTIDDEKKDANNVDDNKSNSNNIDDNKSSSNDIDENRILLIKTNTNNDTSNNQTTNSVSEKNNDGTETKSALPKTGTSRLVTILVVLSVIVALVLGIKIKNYKDIK